MGNGDGVVGLAVAGLVEVDDRLAGVTAVLDEEEHTEQQVRAALRVARRLQRRVDAVVAVLGRQAHRLESEGGPPATETLQDGASVSGATARIELDRLRVHNEFPAVGQAAADAKALPENLDVLARATMRMTTEEITKLTQHDQVLADAACRLPAASFRRKVHRLRDQIRADNGATAHDQAEQDSTARVSKNRDNTGYRLYAQWDPLRGESVLNAFDNELRRLTKTLGEGHGHSREQLAAQALHDLILRGGKTAPVFGDTRPEVHIHVLTDRDTLQHGPHDRSIIQTANGQPLSPATLGRLCCDASLRLVDTAGSANVHVSRSSRTATDAQRSALLALYGGCALSDTPWSQTEIHHIQFASNGGPTQHNNLLPLSKTWHHRIHDQNWRLDMDPDRTLHLYQPDGTHYRTIAPPIPLINQPAA